MNLEPHFGSTVFRTFPAAQAVEELDFVVLPRTFTETQTVAGSDNAGAVTSEHVKLFIEGVDRQIELLGAGPLRHVDAIAGRLWRFEQDGDWYLRLGFGDRKRPFPGHDAVLRLDDSRAAIPTLERVRELAEQRRLDDLIGGLLLFSQ